MAIFHGPPQPCSGHDNASREKLQPQLHEEEYQEHLCLRVTPDQQKRRSDMQILRPNVDHRHHIHQPHPATPDRRHAAGLATGLERKKGKKGWNSQYEEYLSPSGQGRQFRRE